MGIAEGSILGELCFFLCLHFERFLPIPCNISFSFCRHASSAWHRVCTYKDVCVFMGIAEGTFKW